MTRRIFYVMSGQAHLPYLVCSLHTLRKYWDGQVRIYAWPESYDLAKVIATDRRLGIERVELSEPPYRRSRAIGSNSQFLHKIQMARSMKGQVDSALYLDADTTVHGDLGQLFIRAELRGFCATQWNQWTTNSGIVAKRLKGLYEVEMIDRSALDLLLEDPWPSVNGGVWASRPDSPVLPTWFDWTLAACPMFIADERVLHVLQVAYGPKDQFLTATDKGKWNSCPKLNATLPLDEMVVRHYHGDSCCRPTKSRQGYDSWWPIYQECLQENVGMMSDWRGLVKNKHLDRIDPFVQ